ncbi:hypothetical protein JVT61DRAFT_7951 [Boletus reticuloceps]|uniref:SAM domain-containing protein n=1 Tax=Boletus reticuloceps TaxID=495285 RepID=A0A8I2YHL7_9AGAM|nr:hypothetical protein JVT61DRAFT_7951 [Boletus reticuloceps]
MASRPTSPAEPIKTHPPPIQPNAHPYAIKTTSSALLSRSNSSPHSAHHNRHHYIPSPPPRVPTGVMARHRHSSSLSSVEGGVHDVNGMHKIPAPLPAPQPNVAASPDSISAALKRADEPKLSRRVRRAETKSNSATKPVNDRFSHDQESRPELYAGLPSNPKQWNTDELITYLETSFKLCNDTNGDKDDSSIVGILECVRARGLTGRELLRLTDADVVGTPLSDVQHAQLLERSRTLRADVLRGRIYVDSYHSHEVSDNSQDTHSARSSAPLHSIRGCSASTDDLHSLLDNNTGEGQSAFPPSPVLSLHRSHSVSDASAQRYRDLARMRIRRRGRVKGLVETWERASTSGSECSASEPESESETDPELESISDAKHSPEFPSLLPPSPYDESPQSVCSSVDSSAVVSQEPPSSTPPPPYTHMHSTLEAMGDEEEEPSIDELLALSSEIPLKGARAWEADFGLGDTVKRISVPGSVDAGRPIPLVMEQGASRPQDDDQQTKSNSVRSKGSGMRRSTGNRGKSVKTQKRVVTAIFTGSPSGEVSENLCDGMHLDHHRYASSSHGDIRSEVSASSGPQNDPDNVLRSLEESIAVTRAQLEAYRLRLEKVEADTARYEAMFTRALPSDSCHSSEFELRQRRSEADVKATADTTELRRNASIAGARDRDVLEGWETMPLADVARAIVARAIGWLFPYRHMGACVPDDHDKSGSHSGANDRCHSPVKRNGRLPTVRMSCNLILFSFAICAAVLRRMGFGRWVGRP